MICEFVAAIHYLSIEEKEVKLYENAKIYGKREEEITSIFTSNQYLVSEIGMQNIISICRNSLFYWNSSHENLNRKFGIETLHQIIHKMHAVVLLQVSGLWLIKDNSCFSHRGYLISHNRTSVESNIGGTFLSDSTGSNIETSFTKEEIKTGFKIMEKLIGLFNRKPSNKSIDLGESDENFGAMSPFLDHFGSNRIKRAWGMIMTARSTVLIPMKIAFYISSLECLLTTDSKEVTSKVAMRVALLIGGSGKEKISNKSLIVKAYDIRSKFIHGVGSKNKEVEQSKLVTLSRNIDQILRTIFLKIIEDENLTEKFLATNNEVINDYFDSLIYQ